MRNRKRLDEHLAYLQPPRSLAIEDEARGRRRAAVDAAQLKRCVVAIGKAADDKAAPEESAAFLQKRECEGRIGAYAPAGS